MTDPSTLSQPDLPMPVQPHGPDGSPQPAPQQDPAQAGDATVLTWEDDPGTPDQALQPIARPRPALGTGDLPVRISGTAPTDGSDAVGTAGFRYWAGAEAMRRAADFWSGITPAGMPWNPVVGPALTGFLDNGDDMNAYYDRTGLRFFHHDSPTLGVVYSGESPDVVCHELGHAVLDAVRPQLWDAASVETAAFHESFADVSALLTALQLPSVREAVLTETGGDLSKPSRLSRLAEQLGAAIREVAPQAVDPDCLRNAANDLQYADPSTLPARAPATQVSSEVHSFSRVFTGAYLRIIAALFAATDRTQASLATAAGDAGRLLLRAVTSAPITTFYFAQVAAHVVAADSAQFGGSHVDAIKASFEAHAILAPLATASLTEAALAEHLEAFAGSAPPAGTAPLPEIEVSGATFAEEGPVTVVAAAEQPRFAVAPTDNAGRSSAETTARTFIQTLIARGQVEFDGGQTPRARRTTRLRTHRVQTTGGTRRLVRQLFE